MTLQNVANIISINHQLTGPGSGGTRTMQRQHYIFACVSLTNYWISLRASQERRSVASDLWPPLPTAVKGKQTSKEERERHSSYNA